MKRVHHYQRYSIENAKAALADTPVVFIMGLRQSGKTTLVQSLLNKNWQYISLDDQTQLAIAKSDPVGFIKNLTAVHVAIDEIQRLPELLLAIKHAVDEVRTPGRFLLTGSSNALVLPQVVDSLAGRIEAIPLNTLSECEINQVTPSFLTKLIAGKAPVAKDVRIREYLIQRIVTGCFPEPVQRRTPLRIKAWYKQYINSLIQKDLKDIDQIEHPNKMRRLLQLMCFYSGKLVNFSELGSRIDLDRATVKKYISLLEQLFLIKPLPAWHSNYYKRLVKTPKLHVADTGIICAVRDIDPAYLASHLGDLGHLVETFVINELRKQADWLDQDLMFYHYRDKDKVEVDCIIENSNGDCFAIEVKASATLSAKDFTGLQRFKTVAGEQFKLGVLLYDGDHTTAFADGLFAVPISALWS